MILAARLGRVPAIPRGTPGRISEHPTDRGPPVRQFDRNNFDGQPAARPSSRPCDAPGTVAGADCPRAGPEAGMSRDTTALIADARSRRGPSGSGTRRREDGSVAGPGQATGSIAAVPGRAEARRAPFAARPGSPADGRPRHRPARCPDGPCARPRSASGAVCGGRRLNEKISSKARPTRPPVGRASPGRSGRWAAALATCRAHIGTRPHAECLDSP